MGEIVEIQNPLTFRVVYDEELDFLYANIPVKVTPGALKKIIALTGDSWRYVEDKGLILDLLAWVSESGMDVQAIGKALEEEYKGLLGEIKKIVEGAATEEGKRERKKEGAKRKKRAHKKAKKKARRGKGKGAKKKGEKRRRKRKGR